MKSMCNTTGLGPGAGVVVLCRFPVTLSTPCCYKVAAKTRRRPHPPPSPCRLYRADRFPIGGRGTAPSHPAKNLHSTTISAEMARPVELCMKSMRRTTGLGSGVGVVVLCRFRVTLSPQSRRFGLGSTSTTCSGAPPTPSPAPFPSAVYEAGRSPGAAESPRPSPAPRSDASAAISACRRASVYHLARNGRPEVVSSDGSCRLHVDVRAAGACAGLSD
jgi:hypothetical protein